MTHDLKTWPDFYERIISGEKNFEARRNDRGFQKGDLLRLLEWCPKKQVHTGNSTVAEVGYVLTGEEFGVKEGFCVMSLIKPSKENLNNQ